MTSYREALHANGQDLPLVVRRTWAPPAVLVLPFDNLPTKSSQIFVKLLGEGKKQKKRRHLNAGKSDRLAHGKIDQDMASPKTCHVLVCFFGLAICLCCWVVGDLCCNYMMPKICNRGTARISHAHTPYSSILIFCHVCRNRLYSESS
jgi:hypothetical protein